MIKTNKCEDLFFFFGLMFNLCIKKKKNDYEKTGTYTKNIRNEERLLMIKKHYELLLKDKPEKLALLEIRANAIWYLKGMPKSAEIKNKICSSKTSKELFEILDEYYNTCF